MAAAAAFLHHFPGDGNTPAASSGVPTHQLVLSGVLWREAVHPAPQEDAAGPDLQDDRQRHPTEVQIARHTAPW